MKGRALHFSANSGHPLFAQRETSKRITTRLRCRTEALLTEATVFLTVGETRRHALYNLCEGNRRHAPLRHTERQRSIYKILHFVQNDSEECKVLLRSRRMTNRGATDPTLTRRRVLNAHSGCFRKGLSLFFIMS